MCINAYLLIEISLIQISLHVCVRKIAIILWKFHIPNEFLSYLPLKVYLFLKNILTTFWFLTNKKGFETNFLKKYLTKTYGQGNVRSGKCPVGEMS